MPLIPLLVVFSSFAPFAQSSNDTRVGVVYAARGPASDASVRQDLERIRRAGFNMVVVADRTARARVTRLLSGSGLGVADPSAPARRIAAAAGGRATAEARVRFWRAIAEGTRTIVFAGTGGWLTPEVLALGETAGVVTRNQALFSSLRPRKGGIRSVSPELQKVVTIHLLESDENLVLIGVARGTRPVKGTITFEPGIPEAIWQNLETGTSVNFVLGPEGPVLEHTFAPRDSLVLMVGKRFR